MSTFELHTGVEAFDDGALGAARLRESPRVSGFGFRVSGFGFRVSGFGCRVYGLWFMV